MPRSSLLTRPRALVLTGGVVGALILPILPAAASSVPTIVGVAPSPAHVGRTVTITGSGLTGTTAVALGGTAMTFRAVDDAHVTATVPSGATSAAVTVTNDAGTATSGAPLEVAVAPPAVTGLVAKVGDRVLDLSWTGGGTGGAVVRDISGVVAPVSPASGRGVVSSGSAAGDRGFANTAQATYAVWALDSDGTTSDQPATATVEPVAAVATAVRATASATRVAYGTRLLLTGRLTRGAQQLGMARAPVDVLVRPGGSPTAAKVAQVTTGNDGSVSYIATPRGSATYQLRFNGDAFSAPATSGQPSVAVQPRISAGLSASAILRGQTTHLRGTLVPNYSGVRAQVQRRAADGSWRAISVVAVSAAGAYDASFTPGVGSYLLRVVLPGSAGYLTAASGVVTLSVGQRTLVQGDRGGEVVVLERRLAGLQYDVGNQNGVFDYDLRHAVLAFQKLERLPRTGDWGNAERSRIDRPTAFRLRYPSAGRAFEIDITRQVLVMSTGGAVQRILDVSTGTDQLYTVDGVTDRANTPRGRFSIFRKGNGVDVSRLGELYRPAYFFEGWAIHGSGSVPAFPASHGCVRITDPAMDRLYALLTVGTPVALYDS